MTYQIEFKRAYYIKLGIGGKWEQSSICESKMRIGWGTLDTEDANRNEWQKILERGRSGNLRKDTATKDRNALWRIHDSSSDDIWITFSVGDLWWCKLTSSDIQRDSTSAYRPVDGKWSNKDINGNRLAATDIPGDLSKTQGFRGTVCRVHAIDSLRRVLNDEASIEYREIEASNKRLIQGVAKGIRKLQWKDFETFVDLIFRGSGWRRLSMLGETMKTADLELEDPITRDRYQVQVKSRATRVQFENYSSQFNPDNHRRSYFVVHSPDKMLAALGEQKHEEAVELILADRLSEMAVRLGLVEWLLNRIR